MTSRECIETLASVLRSFAIETPSHINDLGDSRVPFHHYANQSASLVPRRATTTFEFLKLPVELQDMILEYCDGPTLFALSRMHSTLHHRARTLFFSHESTWYHIESSRVIESNGASLNFDACPYFAQDVKQVELECHRWGRGNDLPAATTDFWAQLFVHFPSLKRLAIVYSQPDPHAMEELLAMWNDVPIISSSKLDIYVSAPVSLDECLNSWRSTERVLYHFDADKDWKIVAQPWIRECVLPPRVKINGHIGKFLQLQWKKDEGHYRSLAVAQIRDEILQKHHFMGAKVIPIDCTYCETQLYSLGERQNHILQQHHTRWKLESEAVYVPLPRMPELIESAMILAEGEVKQYFQAADENEKGLCLSWGMADTDSERRTEKIILDEIINNPAFGAQGDLTENWMWKWIDTRWSEYKQKRHVLSAEEDDL